MIVWAALVLFLLDRRLHVPLGRALAAPAHPPQANVARQACDAAHRDALPYGRARNLIEPRHFACISTVADAYCRSLPAQVPERTAPDGTPHATLAVGCGAGNVYLYDCDHIDRDGERRGSHWRPLLTVTHMLPKAAWRLLRRCGLSTPLPTAVD